MKVNKIFNEDCFDTMNYIISEGRNVQLILTSPPYGTGRPSVGTDRGRNNNDNRYDTYKEKSSDDGYIEWSIDLFNMFDKVLKEDGVILYNMSYGGDVTNVKGRTANEIMYRTIFNILDKTDFTIADTIVWKKSNALPNNTSRNKLTRIYEFIFVIVRRSELKTFHCNKQVKSVSKTGQNFYENMFNFIEAKNNDGSTKLNKATFSSDLVIKLLDMYARSKGIVYDPFMGTGTTGVGCVIKGLKYIGSEISTEQCRFAKERIKATKELLK